MSERRRPRVVNIEVSLGRDGPAGSSSLWVPALKLAAVGLAALVVINRRDIRRYLRLRRM